MIAGVQFATLPLLQVALQPEAHLKLAFDPHFFPEGHCQQATERDRPGGQLINVKCEIFVSPLGSTQRHGRSSAYKRVFLTCVILVDSAKISLYQKRQKWKPTEHSAGTMNPDKPRKCRHVFKSSPENQNSLVLTRACRRDMSIQGWWQAFIICRQDKSGQT